MRQDQTLIQKGIEEGARVTGGPGCQEGANKASRCAQHLARGKSQRHDDRADEIFGPGITHRGPRM